MTYVIYLESETQICKDTLGAKKTPLIQHRLDYFLISNELQEDVEHIDILPSVASDHSVVHLKFALSGQNSRGKSYWKFNNSLTEDTNFVESMK